MEQQLLFQKYLNPIVLKEGKTKCPCCGKPMKAYAKNLDKRLEKLAWDILIWLQINKQNEYDPVVVFDNNYKLVCDANKLHYWKIIKHTGRRWYLTKRGYDWLTNGLVLPKRLWVFNNKVIAVDDLVMVKAGATDERWQTCRADYTEDFVPYKYETQPKI